MHPTKALHPIDSSNTTFYIVGINYVKADAEMRGRFSISEEGQAELLKDAQREGIEALCIVSTCNRTEIFGVSNHPYQLIKLLCEYSNGTLEDFENVGYIHKNDAAVSHLFKVGTGLDSQILGDFEIISQLRNSARRSKELGLLNAYLERLANAVIQASKRIKNETTLSSGATSVSFAAVQFILNRMEQISEKNILLFGIGKIGRNTCENLVKHTENDHITLINRTKVKAQEIAGKFNLTVKDYSSIQSEIAHSDVLIVATGAQQPTINKELLYLRKPLLILDLSIPKNVAPNVAENDLVTLVHLDDLVQMTDATLAERKEQIPAAEVIITEIKEEFLTWAQNRKFAPTIKALKEKLLDLKDGEIDFQKRKMPDFNEAQASIISERLIHKITTHVANHLKNNSDTNESIALIRQVFELPNTP